MKYWKYIAGSFIALSFSACSDKIMDEINRDRNNPADVAAINQIPSVTLESAFGTTGTDLAWYASVFIEHNAGTWGQMLDADTRIGVKASSLANNSWNAVYDNMMILQDIIKKCSPEGSEPQNKTVLGVAQVLMAYNIAVVSDMWGQVPFKEALKGAGNFQPVFDKQQDIYKSTILPYLNKGIENLSVKVPGDIATALRANDLLYGGTGAGSWTADKWIKAAWSLKARYFLHMNNVDSKAIDSVLECVPKGFVNAAQEFKFTRYDGTARGENPWSQFWGDRKYLAAGKTLVDLMAARQDPRMGAYFSLRDGAVFPAPSGTAEQSQGNYYSFSLLGTKTAPTPLMSFHELKFIEAEAQARKGLDFRPALQRAIEESFAYYNVSGATDYYNNKVVPLLGTTQADNLKEILTQKYISFYESESIEAYNDYRRTRIPAMNNPQNQLTNYGFVERLPYPTSEVSSNPANVPSVNIFKNKIWWAGGAE
ncbi:SusD/RagB family nutrient-binding outer membrane lipoprotein [Chitinophaga nivalis]|uniref:SusD/RagB family nutrient-binding outer membrane lipoprotein n=1 Tax=Chitinophaga nivalis TaxID=2991709 RepID=A0ABT3IUG2_9BACT|nr:SusD/RagB family nutrient-binding outer membrane lipoprotein [Chitinophaga nivalis]MCW3462720.1 SusD/RagB family nutrient-binding outer membrane lipoprotein [Chitinophaga nivalis]MCW3487589.1 SusD/RagB family nutrient-binding outer membrane lipoprotein [Chitinophaga nivalis]